MGIKRGRKRERGRSFEAKMPHLATPCKHLLQPPLGAKVSLRTYIRNVVKKEIGGDGGELFWQGMEKEKDTSK